MRLAPTFRNDRGGRGRDSHSFPSSSPPFFPPDAGIQKNQLTSLSQYIIGFTVVQLMTTDYLHPPPPVKESAGTIFFLARFPRSACELDISLDAHFLRWRLT